MDLISDISELLWNKEYYKHIYFRLSYELGEQISRNI